MSAAASMRVLPIVCVIDVLGFGILIPLVPYMGERFGASPEVITAILGSYSLCQFVAAPLWGRLSDRYGRRPILTSSLAGACLSYVILALAHDIWLLLLSRVVAGFMAGNLSAAFAYASDVSTPENRARSMGTVGAAIGIGFMLGIPIGGALAGNDPHTADFVRPALASIALSLLAIALVRLALPESRSPEQRRAPPARGTRAFELLRARAGLRSIAGAALLVICAQGILESIFVIWALARFGVGPRTVGLALFGVGFLTVLMQGGIVRVLVPRIGEAALGAAGAAAYALGLALVAIGGTHLGPIAAGLALAGLGMGAFTPSASALASKQAHAGERGAVMGTYQASTSLARVIGPFVSGYLFTALGPSAPFLVGACVAAPAALLVLRSRGGVLPGEEGAPVLEGGGDAATALSKSERSTPPGR